MNWWRESEREILDFIKIWQTELNQVHFDKAPVKIVWQLFKINLLCDLAYYSVFELNPDLVLDTWVHSSENILVKEVIFISK